MTGGFLIVDDDPLCATTLRRVLVACGAVAIVRTADAAREALHAQPWAGVVLDVGLPDGDGLEVLAAERTLIRTPVLVLTGTSSPDVANRAFDLRAELVIKPVLAERIVSWARRVTGKDDRWLEDALGDWQRTCRLSEAELHVLELTVRMSTHEEIARERHVSVETVKSHSKSLCRKTGRRPASC